MARRISLNAQRALLGEDPGTLPVEFEMHKRLVLNMETARAIGFSPSWSVYVEARLLHPDDMQQRERTLIGSVREAISSNLSLEANRHEVQAGAEEVRNARSNLQCFPSCSEFGTYIAFRESGRAHTGTAHPFPCKALTPRRK